MNWRFLARFVAALVFLAIVVAVGVGAYQLGVTQGLLQSEKIVFTAPPTDPALMAQYAGRPYFWGHPFGWGFFGFLKCLVPLAILFVFFSMLRGLFWRKWAWRHGHGPQGGPGMMHGPWATHMRNTFNEWHQQAHQTEGQTSPTPPPAQ